MVAGAGLKRAHPNTQNQPDDHTAGGQREQWAKPNRPAKAATGRLEQHRIAVRRHEVIEDLLVRFASLELPANHAAHLDGELSWRISHRNALADRTAELFSDPPDPVVERVS